MGNFSQGHFLYTFRDTLDGLLRYFKKYWTSSENILDTFMGNIRYFGGIF